MANLAYIQVTRECNQECRFCSNPPTLKNQSIGFFIQLIDEYIRRGYAGVMFSGGEATLYPQLDQLIAYTYRKKFPLRIITNGQKLADFSYIKKLKEAGLNHVNLSIYSDDAAIQSFLTKNEDSLKNIKKALVNLKRLKIKTDIITVINKYNANHLSRIVRWLVSKHPFVGHFIWNNLDPMMNRASQNKDTIPTLNDFELELHYAMNYLYKNKKTFRVERVPLCYMASFPECSTETRKIVKNEERMIFFLDEKGLVRQRKWLYKKASCCQACSLDSICAGLYQMGKYYNSNELYPLFLRKEEVIKKVMETP